MQSCQFYCIKKITKREREREREREGESDTGVSFSLSLPRFFHSLCRCLLHTPFSFLPLPAFLFPFPTVALHRISHSFFSVYYPPPSFFLSLSLSRILHQIRV